MNIPVQLFAALGHDVRLRCLLLLQGEGELCVCELTHALALAQPAVSRQLALLREVGWVLDRRQGQWVYYRISDRLPSWAREVLASTATGLGARAPFTDDLRRLSGMPNRPSARGCA